MFSNTNNVRMTRFGRGATILRARNGSPLSLDLIAEKCPAVFAADKHSSRSDKYTYISTVELLNGMAREGFDPYEVRNGGSGDVEKRGYTKHMLRFRQRNAQLKALGDTVQEIILVNAHDGTSSYQMFSGWFRLVCLNGMVAADNTRERSAVKIPHKGDVIGQVIDAAYTVIDNGRDEVKRIEHLASIDLNRNEQLAFAEAAATLRWDGDEQRSPITPEQVIQLRRTADDGSDLWRTFNRAQENLIRGGVHYTQIRDVRNDAGQIIGRRRAHNTTRPVQNIDGDVKLNRALWMLAERMAELKTA